MAEESCLTPSFRHERRKGAQRTDAIAHVLHVRLRQRLRTKRASARDGRTPRRPVGLYAEQLSGSPFTRPRATNRAQWPIASADGGAHGRSQVDIGLWRTAQCHEWTCRSRERWSPFAMRRRPVVRRRPPDDQDGGRAGAQAEWAHTCISSTRSRTRASRRGRRIAVRAQSGGLRICTDSSADQIEPARSL